MSVLFVDVGEWLDPLEMTLAQRYLAPSMEHPFGTDQFGRDMLARTLYATGLTFRVVLYAIGVAGVLALILGSVAGYYANTWVDKTISWVISLLFTVPFFLVVIAVFTVIHPNIELVYLVIGSIAWIAPARLVRSVVIQLRRTLFVRAERAFGYSNRHIVLNSFLPLSLAPVLLSLIYSIPELVSVEVGLSFFGLGAQPPTPTLGRLIYDGLAEIYTAWWVALTPAACLATVLGLLYFSIRKKKPASLQMFSIEKTQQRRV